MTWMVILTQIACALFCAGLAAVVIRRAMDTAVEAEKQTGADLQGRVVESLSPLEGQLLGFCGALATFVAWGISAWTLREGQSGLSFAGPVGAIGAAAAVLVVADDVRHHGVQLEFVAPCVAAAVVWSFLVGGVPAAGVSALAAIAGATAIVVSNLLAKAFGADAFNDGDWLLAAAGAAWIGDDFESWCRVLGTSIVVGGLFLVLARGKRASWAPVVALSVIAGMI